MTTLMEQEARQTPAVIAEQLQKNQSILLSLCERLRDLEIPCVMTIARGSSDHAATFAKYLFETYLGLPTVSAAPSIFTHYHAQLQLENALVIAISQSGQSADLYETLNAARAAGAITVAIVNQTNSPLAEAAHYVLPLWAGEEKAVAATKSYLASLTAIAALVATWRQDRLLLQALQELPNYLQQALEVDIANFLELFLEAQDAIVIGRGYGFAIAQELALKFKETSGLHAEAFSSAEVLHGPLALIRTHFPVLLFAQADQTFAGTVALAEKIHMLGGKTLLAAPEDKLIDYANIVLRLPKSLHPVCDPLIAIQAFYVAIAKLAVQRGFDPDKPQHLQKVTITR